MNENSENNIYFFEGIEVIEGDFDFISEQVKSWSPDKILIHFINEKHMEILKSIEYSIPSIIWIHGVEALSWKRRLFNFTGKRFLWYILDNNKKLKSMKLFIESAKNIHFVFVSNWMKKVMEKDVGVSIKNYEVIPNVINTDIFKYIPKDAEQRKKILIIRNFDSRKYANELSIKAILKLKEKEYFSELEFCIYGQGRYFKSLTSQLSNLKNVKIFNTFLPQSKIAEIHKDYGVFLCPTRQDSQGVSMCEAMSSGLVPITSNNTAIPEFVSSEAGYLTDNKVKSIVAAIEDLYFNKEEFTKRSYSSNKIIYDKCKQTEIVSREITFIKSSEEKKS
ncbi:glycosyltransferase family 4 protein [Bacillus haikouensis]|nr:glycosyltransferase family 4 protein [Bacillus haikouensis]